MRLLTKLFLQGLAVVVPLGLTAYIVYWMGSQSEIYLGSLLRSVLPEQWYVPGLGIFTALLLVLLVGVLMRALLFRAIVRLLGKLVERIPLVKSLYGALRDFMEFVSHMSDKRKLNQVVIVNLTDQVRLLGFVTKENLAVLSGKMDEEDVGEMDQALAVYVPLSYQIGGYTLLISKSMIDPVDLSVEDAMRFALTAGMSGLDPKSITTEIRRKTGRTATQKAAKPSATAPPAKNDPRE